MTDKKANAFASTFAFFTTPKPTLKKQKSLQANAPDNADICASLKRHSFGRTEARTDNKGLKEMAGEVVNQTFVLLINSSGRLTVRASKPPLL